MKLSSKQNQVINCLQNGYQLITDSEMTGAIVACSNHEFRINNRVFFNLVDKGLIIQGGQQQNFSYELTKEGREIKTK